MALSVDDTIRHIHQLRMAAIAVEYANMARRHRLNPPTPALMAQYDVEMPNISAMMDTLLEDDHSVARVLVSLYLNISRYLQMRGWWDIKREWGLSLLQYADQFEAADHADLLNNIGVSYERHEDQPAALAFYRRSIKVRAVEHDDPANANTYSNMGVAYRDMGDLDNALSYMFKALAMERERSDRKMVAQSLMNIASVYYQQFEMQKALDFSSEGITIIREMNDDFMLSQAIGNLAVHTVGALQFDEAVPIYEEALALYHQIGDEIGLARTMFNFSLLLNLLKEYDRAADLLAEAIVLMQRYGMWEVAAARDHLGKVLANRDDEGKDDTAR